MNDSTTVSRRGLLAGLTGALAAVPILGGMIVALRVALAPAHADQPARIPLCRKDQVPKDGVLQRPVSYAMRRGPAIESVARVVFVTREPDTGEIIAMAGECTHLSCPVQRSKAKVGPPLVCPCHGGAFSRTGEVLDGPPPRPLRRLRLEVPEDEHGMIHLLAP